MSSDGALLLLLPPPRLLLLYSKDTRAGETREGVPEALSSDAREEERRGREAGGSDGDWGRQEEKKEGLLLLAHWMCHRTGMRSSEEVEVVWQWRKATLRSMHVEIKHGALNFIPVLKNDRPARDMMQPRWLTPWDGAYTGHTSRIVRTRRQQEFMRGGGGSSRRTALSMEERGEVNAKLAEGLLPLPPLLGSSPAAGVGTGRSIRLRLLHQRRVMHV